MPFVRELSEQTLADLAEQVDERSREEDIFLGEVRVDLTTDTENPVLHLGADEVEASTRTMESVTSFLNIPAPFYKRLHPDEREWICNRLIRRVPGVATFMLDPGHTVLGIYTSGKPPINPSRICNSIAKIVGADALVYDHRNSADEFSVDVYAPTDSKHAYTGKVGRLVGDITQAGLTVGQDRKRNLSPYAQPWFMRLACTNGMEMRDEGLKIDGRRSETVDEVLAEFEALAKQAFERVEDAIEHYYALDQKKVPNPERTLRAISREHSVSDRTLVDLLDLAATDELPDDPTMFDIVNLITNQANDPSLVNRYRVRREFQAVGGAVVTESAHRCNHCQQKVLT
jgi:hypothetical protein